MGHLEQFFFQRPIHVVGVDAVVKFIQRPILEFGQVGMGKGASLQFVGQVPRLPAFEDEYEGRFYLRGEVQIRAFNWHDLPSVLTWMVFPRANAALNERHYGAPVGQRSAGVVNCGPVQDTMTLFDEGGVIADPRGPRLVCE
jgi:hypothetical protein